MALIQLLGGSLGGEVATSLSFSVRIDDVGGVPIAGVPISFSPSQGSGTVAPTTLTTGATGQVTVLWTLGQTAGTQSVRVSAGEKSIVVEVTATPGAPATLVALAGQAQTGVVGTGLPGPLVTQVQDAFGNGVSGVVVTFEPAAGAVAMAQVTTDSDGNAQTEWTLGELVGAQTLSSGADAGSVTFSATAEPGPPSSLTLVSGGGQSGQVGTALTEATVLEVRDEFGNGAVGAIVTFSGDGSVDPAGPAADAEARVAVFWTLGTVAGDQVLTATAGAASVDMQAVAVPGPPSVVQALSGTDQETYATATLTQPLEAQVADEFGNVVPGAEVAFVVTLGGGAVDPATAESGADGRVQTTWTLGIVIGAHAMEARVEGADPGVFAAEAVSGPPAQIVGLSGGGQTAAVATTLPAEIVFEILDILGTPVAGAPVTMTVTAGVGSLSSGSALTDASGRVSTTWTLGTGAGTHVIQATVPGVSVPTEIQATALAGPPTQIELQAGNGQSPVVGNAVAVAPAVRVTDAFANPVSGVSVTFAVDGGGGSATGVDQVTDADGVATVGGWTVGGAVGLNTLSATATGVGSVTFNATAVLAPVYDIEVRYAGTPPTPSQQTIFEASAARWEQLVIGELTDIPLLVAAKSCGDVDHPAIDEVVDDLVIFAEVVAIDGAGGILGSAGPCYIRLANGLPVLGSMKFDEADVAALEASGNLGEVILHEMGHVIGIGAVDKWYDILQGYGGADPFFPGAEAVARYTAAAGAAPNPVPVANTGGGGTRYAHWREAHMGRELMTGWLSSGVSNPLSAISVGALQDMGYTVNAGDADAYTVSSSLRLEEDELIPLIEIQLPPPRVIDVLGRVRR